MQLMEGILSDTISSKLMGSNSTPQTSDKENPFESSFLTRLVDEFWANLAGSSNPIFNLWANSLKKLNFNRQNLSSWSVSFGDFLFAVSHSRKGRIALVDLLKANTPTKSEVCICPVRFRGLLPKGSAIIRELRDVPILLDQLSVEGAYLWLRSVAHAALDEELHSSGDKTLKILTYNVCGLPKPLGTMDSNPRRFYRIGRQIRELSADIVGLQEMWESNTSLVLKASHYKHRFSELEVEHLKRKLLFGRSGLAIASRYPMSDCELLAFSSTSGLERVVNKGAIYARIQTPNGEVDVYNVHLTSEPERLNKLFVSLSYSHKIRDLQLRELNDWIKRRSKPGVPVYVMGDFNFTEEDNLYRSAQRFLGEDLFRMRYGFIQKDESPEIENNIFGATFDPMHNIHAKSPRSIAERLDYIWCKRENEDANHLYAAERVFTKNPLSDHFGVLVTIQEEF